MSTVYDMGKYRWLVEMVWGYTPTKEQNLRWARLPRQRQIEVCQELEAKLHLMSYEVSTDGFRQVMKDITGEGCSRGMIEAWHKLSYDEKSKVMDGLVMLVPSEPELVAKIRNEGYPRHRTIVGDRDEEYEDEGAFGFEDGFPMDAEFQAPSITEYLNLVSIVYDEEPSLLRVDIWNGMSGAQQEEAIAQLTDIARRQA